MDQKTFSEEQNHLKYTIDQIIDAKRVLEQRINSLGSGTLEKLKDFRSMPDSQGADVHNFLQSLHEANLSFNLADKFKRVEEMEFLQKEPYFSRLDLKNSSDTTSYYIGKFGFTLDQPIVIDWRAKIASIYYRYRYPQKNVKYTTPDGDVVLDLALKRTFEIDNGELIKIYNNDIQLDENQILSDKIEQRSGGVLEDIIETIQEGQLDIIESDPRKVCIVQGCVGSGKSTVAIHKLSHIFFNFPELIQPERAILIAKNQILVGYLSTLFPKLGIFDISYKSLRELVYAIVFGEDFKISIDFEIEDDFSKFTLAKINDLKERASKMRDEVALDVEKLFLRPDYSAWGGYKFLNTQSPYENLNELIKELEEEIALHKDYLSEDSTSSKADRYKINIRTLRRIIRDLHKLKSDIPTKQLKELCAASGLNINKKLSYVDTMIYLLAFAELIGINKTKKYQYCVLDEGQDFSVLEYAVLSKIVINGRFCILGDLNQSYADEGLSKWEEVTSVIKEAKEAETFELSVNYRNTKQIIDFSNKILSPYTQKYLPKPINRMGSEPVVRHFPNNSDLINQFKSDIQTDIKHLDKTVGIIAFTPELYEEALKITESLNIPKEQKIILRANEKIVYLQKAVYLTKFEDCKGLEFSKVYVLGANVNNTTNFLDAKKAFVACTRAMNELIVYF